jgi:uncharacterized protein
MLKNWRYEPFKEEKKRHNRLMSNLKDQYEIEKPRMPNQYNARYKLRKIRFERILPYINKEDLVLIGYSMGGIFLAKYLSENTFPKKIKQLHLIAPVSGNLTHPEEYIADFEFDPEQLKNLIPQVEKVFLYGSTDDPIIPFSHIEQYHKHLPQAKFTTFTDRGHFWQPEFPELLENIMK